MLELVGDDRTPFGEPESRVHVAIAADDDQVGHDRRGARRIWIEDSDPVPHRHSGLTEHPPELAATEDPDGRRRLDGRAADAELTQHVADPRGLPVGVVEGAGRAGGHDRGLEPGVFIHQIGIGSERIAESEVGFHLGAIRDDVAVDVEDRAFDLDGADQHRSGRRPRIGAGLGSETEFVQVARDPRDLVWLRVGSRDRGLPCRVALARRCCRYGGRQGRAASPGSTR